MLKKAFFLASAAACVCICIAPAQAGDDWKQKEFANKYSQSNKGIWQKDQATNGWQTQKQDDWKNAFSKCPQGTSCNAQNNSNASSSPGWKQETPWGSAPGTYAMKDGGKLVVDGDGTKHFQAPDGSEKIMRPDGTGIWKKADGSQVEKFPDGHKVYRFPDGSEKTFN